MSQGNVSVHRVTIPAGGVRSGWPRAWVIGQVPGLERRDPAAPASVRVLIANVATQGGSPGSGLIEFGADPSAETASFEVTQGADGVPGWTTMAVGNPFVLRNPNPAETMEVTIVFEP